MDFNFLAVNNRRFWLSLCLTIRLPGIVFKKLDTRQSGNFYGIDRDERCVFSNLHLLKKRLFNWL